MSVSNWGYAGQILVILVSFLTITVWTLEVGEVFRIETGSNGPITRTGNLGGSCDDNNMDLASVYRETIDMANVAVTAMNNYASDATVRATLFTFFGIKEDAATHTVSASSATRFSEVRGMSLEALECAGTANEMII